MHVTRALLQQRQPLIKFLGKRSVPKKIDHTPQPHPAAETSSLPSSFADYRKKAQQHGPLQGSSSSSSNSGSSNAAVHKLARQYGGRIGSVSGRSLGSVQPKQGELFDLSELPERFRRRPMSAGEMDAVTSGGASLFG